MNDNHGKNHGKKSRLAGLGRLRQLGDVNTATGAEMESEAQRFQRLADPANSPKVFEAHQLFPTPADLARRVVELAEVSEGMSVLEPSAGTGALVDALRESQGPMFGRQRLELVEINVGLAVHLQARYPSALVTCADFLTWTPSPAAGSDVLFDRIIMNPPFTRGSDIKHITRAMNLLKPGGRLVAICAAAPSRVCVFEGAEWQWIPLAEKSFASVGTNVNAAIVVMNKDTTQLRRI